MTLNMTRNLVQLLKDLQNHIHLLRTDKSASTEDVLGDVENRIVEIYHRIVTTPTVNNYVLPIDEYDNNDVFLKLHTPIIAER
jgi:hypothetical protein